MTNSGRHTKLRAWELLLRAAAAALIAFIPLYLLTTPAGAWLAQRMPGPEPAAAGEVISLSVEPDAVSAAASGSYSPTVVTLPVVGAIPQAAPGADDLAAEASAEPYADPDLPMIALTFDDGPGGENTTRILDVLEEYGAHATFFLVGSRIPLGEAQVLRAHSLGCELANHTYSHADLTRLSEEEKIAQVEDTNDLIEALTGTRARFVRPPYGNVDDAVREAVEYTLISWSVDPADWRLRDGEKIFEALRETVYDGAIVLMHDMYASSADAAEILVPWLIEEGYQLVTVSELFEARGIDPQPGEMYISLRPQTGVK